MDPIVTAQYGMLAATRRFEASAQRTATIGVEGSTASYEQEAVEQISAKHQFTAQLATIRTADAMWKELMALQERP
ncbi:flagellar basal body rod C-terminal domain-containing protein [Phenylobacterium sp.]|uniref:flagellar basal body rod C-terminal domain-containing protein n=1 Tax=Phenylobacterium sp. TaxID=1871053 RepID=UPI0018477CA0|nr:flagellar hook protein FlgE [Phenylobacterium sp.]MBA4792047.1 flagellar hook protein FlgE [Phenylobacterium sp.]